MDAPEGHPNRAGFASASRAVETDATLNLSELERRYRYARRIVADAGALAMRYFRDPASYAVHTKGLQDQASDADRAVEELIQSGISAEFPQDAWVGEETGRAGDRDARFAWVVDPIDGTQCFVNGIPVWCVSIAVLDEGRPVAGVIFDPNADETFVACRGRGAWLASQPIGASSAAGLADGVVGVGYSKRTAVRPVCDFIADLAAGGGMFQRNGSGALMLAYVAAGRLLGYYEPHINAWDCAAGLVLVAESGGWCNDFFGAGGLDAGGPLLAAAPGVSGTLRRLAGMRDEAP